MKSSDIKVNKIVGEFVWTFALVFAVLASVNGFITGMATPFVAGAVVVLAVLAIGSISGAHINPAVTIAMLSVKKIDLNNAIAYILMQLVAGFMAFAGMSALMSDGAASSLDGGATWDIGILMAEAFGAAIFTFGIASAVKNKLDGIAQAILIGGSLALGIIFAVTTGSLGVLNPAVAIGLGVVSFSYVLGPIIGGIIGVNIHAYLMSGKK